MADHETVNQKTTALPPRPEKTKPEVSKVEVIKIESDGLRGTLAGDLANSESSGFGEDNKTLLKFHGLYQQEDRDQRRVPGQPRVEKTAKFMMRTRLPGGHLTPEQYLTHDRIADTWANGTPSSGSIKPKTCSRKTERGRAFG